MAGSMPAWAPLSIHRSNVAPGAIVSDDTGGREPPYGAPPNRAGLQHFHRLDAGGSADVGPEDGHMACGGLLGHTDRALTCEGDVAVSPLEPEGDVGDAGEISEGDVEGDVDSDNGGATPAPIR